MGHEQQAKNTEAAALRAVVYVRISDEPEGTERGVDRQEADCRAYAAAHGWQVVAVSRENDRSAFKQRTITLPSGERVRRVVRPEFLAMLKRLTDGHAQVMVAYDLDRAVRDPRDLEDLIDVKVLGGFGVRSVTGSLRLNTDSDVAMVRVLVAMANKSSADTARRVARAAKQQAIEGTWHGGRVPFGYHRAGSGALVIDPDAAGLVREAVQRVMAGESLYRIRTDWNERGILTTHGCAWSDKTIKMVLRSPRSKASASTGRSCRTAPARRPPRCRSKRCGPRFWMTPGSNSVTCSTLGRRHGTSTPPAAGSRSACIRSQA